MYFLGIDLGGTNIAAGVVGQDYRLTAKTSRKTKIPCTNDELCGQLAEAALETLEKAGLSLADIPWIGIGSPGTVNRGAGMIEFSNNLHVDHFPVGSMLESRLHKKVILENDANAAAYGEYKAGALKGARHALTVTLGTGVGSGVIIEGKIYAGCNSAGGELGHTVIVAGGRQCTCARRGCWEAYSSARGLIVSTLEAMTVDHTSAMWQIVGGDLNRVDGRTAFLAMRAGDATAKTVVDQYVYYLSCGLVNCINILQPDILCVGGGIGAEGEALLAPVREIVGREVYSKYAAKQTKICRAQLGNDAGIVGAALLGE